jgi:hypothetical protein
VVESVLNTSNRRVRLLIPFQRGDVVTYSFQVGTVHHQQATERGTLIDVTLPSAAASRLAVFTVTEKELPHDSKA